jgi:hypothetical protein
LRRPARYRQARIAEWLTSLGLSEYTERFTENGIDTSVLPDLTSPSSQHLNFGTFIPDFSANKATRARILLRKDWRR